MIDFGLKPCPLCGGAAQVEHLTSSVEKFDAVISCAVCGLTLKWKTEIKVGISRSGKHTAVKAGPDPIEAWNRRSGCDDCDNCGARLHSDQVSKLPNCNDCGAARDCVYIPKLGQMARINCPLWRPMEETP